MRVIIAGSRTIPPHLGHEAIRAAMHIAKALDWDIHEVVCGKARGIDTYGEMWAFVHGIPVKPFHADWDTHGKQAGYRRNQQMADYAGEQGGLIAITNGSPGTAHMIRIARARKMRVIVIEIP